MTDNLIDYALCEGSDDEEILPPELLGGGEGDTVAASSATVEDSVETSNCSTIAGAEEDNETSVNSTATSGQRGSPSGNSAQLLIPAQIETDTCVVEKILISRIRPVHKELVVTILCI